MLVVMVYAAIQWIGQSDWFSDDWWGGVAYCGLTFVMLALCIFSTYISIENSGWKVPRLDQFDWIVGWVFYVLARTFWILCVVFVASLHMLSRMEMKNAPATLSLIVAGLFLAYIVFTCHLNDTNMSIREKTDPNFRRACGFS